MRSAGWQADFLAARRHCRPARARRPAPRATPIGSDLGPLTAAAAEALGLTDRLPRRRRPDRRPCRRAGRARRLRRWRGRRLDRHIALIAGTSTCHMALSAEPRPVPGVWGPYLGAVLPGLWLNEGGQSATGALLDHIVAWHGAAGARRRCEHRAHGRAHRRAARERGRGFAAACTCCPTSTATARRSPTRTPPASSAA